MWFVLKVPGGGSCGQMILRSRTYVVAFNCAVNVCNMWLAGFYITMYYGDQASGRSHYQFKLDYYILMLEVCLLLLILYA